MYPEFKKKMFKDTVEDGCSLSTDKCLQAARSQVGLPECTVMGINADRFDKTPEQAVNKVNWPAQKVSVSDYKLGESRHCQNDQTQLLHMGTSKATW